MNNINANKIDETKVKDESVNKLINAMSKLYSVLNKFDDLNQYQERFHRISKTIKSIEAHADCYVSNFSLEKNEIFGLNSENNNYQTEYINIDTKKGTLDFLNESDKEKKENFKLDFQELLNFMENELEIKKAIDINQLDITKSNTSSDSENEVKSKNNSKKINDKNFFNIEIKLRAFIKQQQKYNELFDGTDFTSFMEQLRLKTPLKNQTPIKPAPSFIKNFFQESKIDMENIKKKRSTMAAEQLKKNLNKFLISDNTNVIKPSMGFKPVSAITKIGGCDEPQKKISNFNCETINEDIENELKQKDSLVAIENKIRNSTFKNPYMYDADNNEVNDDLFEPKTADDVASKSSEQEESNNSETDEDDQSDSEYVEIEEEVEEEIEVIEKILKKSKK